MQGLPSPQPMDVTGDVVTNWKLFRSTFEDYVIATKLNTEPAAVQLATLRTVMGKESRVILEHLSLSDDDRKDLAKVLDALENYFKPKVNVVYERYLFRDAKQKMGEPIDTYVTRLKKLASSCQYGALEDELIRDNIVYGVTDDNLRIRLLRDADLTLNAAIDLCRASEQAAMQSKVLQKDDSEVNFVHQNSGRTRKPPRDSSEVGTIVNCKYCGSSHARVKEKCPAFGQECSKCSKKNHFARCCLSKPGGSQMHLKSPVNKKHMKVHAVSTDDISDNSDSDICYTVTNSTKRRYLTMLTFMHNGREVPVCCNLDTGASCNTMPMKIYRKIVGEDCQPLPSSTTLRTYNGGLVKPLGYDRLRINHQGTEKRLHFEIVEHGPVTLLSGNTCERLELLEVDVRRVNHLADLPVLESSRKLTKETVLSEYSDVFKGLGNIGKLCIHTNSAVKPVQNHTRRVPVALQKELKRKLQSMEADGIIAKVVTPTQWISNMVCVKKQNGSLRICLDPQHLNQAVYRNHFPSQTLEALTPRLLGARVFSVCDAKDGFLQCELETDSSYLTTFWTPFGRYRWRRLPFGLNCSPEEFQRLLSECLEGLENIEVIADDILIFGAGDTEESAVNQHDEAFRALLQRARERNLKLNPDKLRFKLKEVSYMGHIIGENGVRVDPDKMSAIVNMPQPADTAAVQRLLGMVNFLSRFTPHLSTMCEPLRRLVETDAPFEWRHEQQQAFEAIKRAVSDAPTLKYYDVNRPVTVECDASSVGLGAVLLQDGQPVAFASRSLSKTERNYAPLEAEALAIVFACEHFDSYLLGRDSITIHSDHKPLEMIFGKSILSAPKRLQRMRLRLQRYPIVVKYKPGRDMYIPDALSRAPVPRSTDKAESGDTVIYHLGALPEIYTELEQIQATDGEAITDARLDRIRRATTEDSIMSQLCNTILCGWPNDKHQVQLAIRDYWPYRDELSVADGLIFRGTRVVIPHAMRPEMVRKSHEAHQGIEATKKLARDVIYWPRMEHDLEDACRACEICQELAPNQPTEPMLSYPIPEFPFQVLSSDIFQFEGEYYLVIVDHYSDYIEVERVPDLTTDSTLNVFKKVLSTHGIPMLLITDNGSNFMSQEFSQFLRQCDIQHITSSPHHHQGNGRAEVAVKVAKGLLKRSLKDNTPLWMLLLDQRNTPSKLINSSPVQRLMSRRTRTLLPVAKSLLKPHIISNVSTALYERKQHNKSRRHGKPLPELSFGQTVLVKARPQQKRDPWVPARVGDQVAPRSYEVHVPGQGRLRRNRKHIREAHRGIEHQSQSIELEIPEQAQATDLSASRDSASTVSPAATDVDLTSPVISGDTSSPSIQTTRSGRTVKVPRRYTD